MGSSDIRGVASCRGSLGGNTHRRTWKEVRWPQISGPTWTTVPFLKREVERLGKAGQSYSRGSSQSPSSIN